MKGRLNLNEVRAKDKKTRKGIEKISSQVIFLGQEAKIESLKLRLGSSDLNFHGVVKNLLDPTVRYTLRAPKVNLVDLTKLSKNSPTGSRTSSAPESSR